MGRYKHWIDYWLVCFFSCQGTGLSMLAFEIFHLRIILGTYKVAYLRTA